VRGALSGAPIRPTAKRKSDDRAVGRSDFRSRAMILDTAEAFNVLEHYGIRIASSKTRSIALHGEDIAIVGRRMTPD
jgi:hypothetical protein